VFWRRGSATNIESHRVASKRAAIREGEDLSDTCLTYELMGGTPVEMFLCDIKNCCECRSSCLRENRILARESQYHFMKLNPRKNATNVIVDL
jgi:hypothetical protein